MTKHLDAQKLADFLGHLGCRSQEGTADLTLKAARLYASQLVQV